MYYKYWGFINTYIPHGIEITPRTIMTGCISDILRSGSQQFISLKVAVTQFVLQVGI